MQGSTSGPRIACIDCLVAKCHSHMAGEDFCLSRYWYFQLLLLPIQKLENELLENELGIRKLNMKYY